MKTFTALLMALSMSCLAAVYHLDSAKGNDANDGLTPETAWQTLQNIATANIQPGDSVLFKRGGLWRGHFTLRNGEPGKPVLFSNYGEGPLPIIQDSLAMDNESDWDMISEEKWSTRNKMFSGYDIDVDVGNIIINHGDVPCPRKRWNMKELKEDLEYFYDREAHCVVMRSPVNPALRFDSIELALHHGLVVSHNNAHDAIVDGLAVRYGACHGFGGSGAKNITIRNCDIYFIGGGVQQFKDDGTPVRLGNGVEFWNSADNCLVENNRIWEIYDTGLTAQGRTGELTNLTFRNNLVWNTEYSFEYWNGETGRTANILFENNTCIDSGRSWGHGHRPDPFGTIVAFYPNLAPTENFIIRNNIFVNATAWGMRMWNNWMDKLVLSNNLWYTADRPLYAMSSPQENYYMTHGLQETLKKYNNDLDSIFAKPIFVDEANRDYRLAPDSPGYGKNIGRQ